MGLFYIGYKVIVFLDLKILVGNLKLERSGIVFWKKNLLEIIELKNLIIEIRNLI